jgi:glycosyltransferase involved in cell wall biosynthesis
VARRHQVPAILIHHFANPLLSGLSVRQQAAQVEWVGGASAVGVPRYLRGRFTNLSDSVDLAFFDPSRASAPAASYDAPVLYVPARITPEKGQLDVVRAASLLGKEGQRVHVVFAGRVDSPAFEKELRTAAHVEGMAERVHFLGPVGMETYRDHFKIAAAMPLLSRHVEGMPRTLVDAQAMEVPPVAYDAGGSREGLRHGETGFLVRAGDLRAAADRLKSLLARSELRERMGRAGRSFVSERFGRSPFAARHEELYLRVIERFRKARTVMMGPAAAVASWLVGDVAPLLYPLCLRLSRLVAHGFLDPGSHLGRTHQPRLLEHRGSVLQTTKLGMPRTP